MSRYIDADALTWIVEEYKLAISPITEDQEHDNRLPLQMLTEFENMVAEQPTVDAVPIVRCKDCENWDERYSIGSKSIGNYRCRCNEWSDEEDGHCTYRYTAEDDFCSYAERRESGRRKEKR